MQTRAPSPALVISIIALVVACSATAYAATRITSSSQIKNGIITGKDIKNRSIKGVDIAKGVISSGSGGGGAQSAIEITRKVGPTNQPANQNIKVVDLSVPAGAYVISAKTTQQAFPPTGILGQPVTVGLGHCKLDAAGDVDDSTETVAANQRSASGQHYMQMTRTFGATSTVSLICDAGVEWNTTNSSIIAEKVGSVSKTNTGS
ncbi:MAG: hypothetical protein QOG15_1530 [Solirubrobacteraceae bacterium]|jgi:hypothetical protein|nr:hypothetical protein [Solirubrobacteraceae bacterium]